MLDALCNDPSPKIEGSNSIPTIIRMVKASITLEPGQLAAVTSGISDERNNAWLGSLFTLIPNMQIPEELSKIVRTWNPLSKSEPSVMEYLISVILLSEEQLSLISLPTSLSGELAIIYGLLLSRKGLHSAAIRVLFDNLPITITAYGQGSLEVGIVAAECANCYNTLRQENIANIIATRFLALRTSPYLSNRQDWFFLSLSRIDSLIGTGEYHQADLGLQTVMAKPSIPTSIYTMSCLRLSKIRRRTAGTLNPKAIPGAVFHLQTGIKLFAQVPTVLQDEILEEVACELATKHCFDQEIQQAESLMKTVNNHLSTMTINTTPAQLRYEKTQFSVKERILHEKDVPRISPKEQRQATSVHGQNTFPHTTLANISTPTGEGTRKVFMVPHQRHPKFVSRVEVTRITELLTRPRMPNICLIYGEAGIGKSAIATEVVYSCHQDFDVIIWVESGSTSEVNCRLHSIATGLGIDGLADSSDGHARARECMIDWLKQPFTTNRFSSKPVEYLIVFDGFGNEEALKPFWPSNSTPCSVLVTARNNISLPHIYNRYTNPHEIKVGFLSSPQATQLLDYSFGSWSDEVGESRPPIFEDHPLTILKAVQAIRSKRVSAWHIEDDFKDKLNSSLDHEDFKSQLNHSKSLIMLWFFDFASQKAKDLIEVISFFEQSGTPETLLSSSTLPRSASSELLMAVDELELARDELLEFSLIWKNHETDSLATSPNIGSLIRDNMSQNRFEFVYAALLSQLYYVWPCTFDHATHVDDFAIEHSGSCSLLWPQVRELKRRSQSIATLKLSSKTSIECIRILLDISWHVPNGPSNSGKVLISHRCATRSFQYEEADGYLTMASAIFSHLETVSLSQSDLLNVPPRNYRLPIIYLRCLFFHHQAWLGFKSGELEMGLNFFNQCLQWLDNGFKLRDEGKLKATGRSLRASVLQGLGMLKLHIKQAHEAVEHYTCCLRTLDLFSNCFGHRRLVTVHIQVGYAYLMDNRPSEAEASFKLASALGKTSNFEEDTLFDTRNFPMYVPLISRKPMLMGFSKLRSSYGLLKYGLTLAKLNQHAVKECLEMALEFFSSCSYDDDQLIGTIYIIMSCCHARNSDRYLAM
ncbi:nb-arc and tpr domain protein [Fusarium avenaceum]|nr:nb-arc and tpr domain protein [Fusarium avenaceum]